MILPGDQTQYREMVIEMCCNSLSAGREYPDLNYLEEADVIPLTAASRQALAKLFPHH